MADFTTVHKRYNHHHNGQITNPNYDLVHSSRDVCHTHLPLGQQVNHATAVVVLIEEPYSECSIHFNFPNDNQCQQIWNLNLAFNHHVTASIDQLGPVVSKASLLAVVMVEQPII